MPRGDGTGPDGKGPKNENKGWPSKDGRGAGQGRRGQGCGVGRNCNNPQGRNSRRNGPLIDKH